MIQNHATMDTVDRPPCRVARNALAVLAVSFVSQLGTASIYVISARAAAPDQFGAVISLIGLVTTFVGVADFGCNALASRDLAARRRTVSDVVSGMVSRAMLVSLGAGLLSIVLASLSLYAMPLAILGAGLAVSMSGSFAVQALLRGQNRALLSSLAMAMDRSLALAVLFLLLSLGAHPIGSLLLALTLGSTVVTLIGCMYFSRGFLNISGYWRGWPYRGSMSFGVTASATSLQTLDVSVIHWSSGALGAGEYGAVARWTAPLNMIVGAYLQPALPELARQRDLRSALRRLKSSVVILGIAWLAAITAAIASPWIISATLGASYAGSAPVFSLLALATIPAGLNQLFLLLFQAQGFEKDAAVRLVFSVALQLSLIAILSHFWNAAGAAAAILTAQIVLATWLIFHSFRLTRPLARQEALLCNNS
jgi:O-antigen/teichoic acid export membrane protein